jgi:HEAT repeat protein
VLVEDSIPGSIVRYIGPCAPVPFVDESEEAYLEVNSRDFLASLQRLVRQEDEVDLKGIFPNQAPLPPGDAIFDEFSGISTDAISALVFSLRDEFEGVRETSTYALGFIGLPEAADAVSALTRTLTDPAPQVRTMAAWALGRLGPSAWSAAPALLTSLKDTYWKVRTAACIALSTTGQNIGKKAYPVLTKILKDGTINRITVAETIVKLGASGEALLIEILTKERLGNVKLRASIVKALSQANVSHNNIDFVVETLFKLSGDRMAAVRKECLLTLQTLSAKAKSQVTYLKPRTILPLFYKFLRDLEPEVKEAALQCIYEAGPHGQLLLVEGLSKDTNSQTRAQAARGLGMFGPSTFRSLLLGLHDGSAEVRNAVAKTIVVSFSLEAVLEEFLDKPAQRQGIKCALKEILSLPYTINQTCTNFLRDLLTLLDEEQQAEGEPSQMESIEEY